MLHICEINYPHGTRGVVSQVNVVTVDERAVNTARNRLGVFRNWLGMRGIRGVEKGDAVPAVGRAFARDDQNPPVSRGADVIDQSRIDLDRVGLFRMGRIRDVVNQQIVRDG